VAVEERMWMGVSFFREKVVGLGRCVISGGFMFCFIIDRNRVLHFL
jgi:hypothetical protein